MRTCTCKDWQPGIDKINAYISLQFARSGGATQYTGQPFNFCPWCGKKLVDEEKQKLKKNPQFPMRRNTKCIMGGRHKWVYYIPPTGIRFGYFKCEKCGVKQFDTAKGKQ